VEQSIGLNRVGNDVVRYGLSKVNRLNEDVGPVTNASKVILKTRAAVSEVLREFLKSESEVVETIKDRLVGTNVKVSNSLLNISSQVGDVTSASLDFWQVVVTNEAVDKTSNDVVGIIESGTINGSRRNGTNSQSKEVSNISTKGEVVWGGPVFLGSVEFSLGLDGVGDDVCGNIISKSNWLSEDVSPGTDAGKIILKAGAAVSEVLRKLLEGKTEVVKTRESVLVGSLVE